VGVFSPKTPRRVAVRIGGLLAVPNAAARDGDDLLMMLEADEDGGGVGYVSDGDYNQNSTVDVADYDVWHNNLG